jgi:hypothetical protein
MHGWRIWGSGKKEKRKDEVGLVRNKFETTLPR